MQKVALAIQALNGKLFHKRKLYVNSNNRSPKRTPDVTEQPQELLVGAWPLYSQGCSVVTFFFFLIFICLVLAVLGLRCYTGFSVVAASRG